MCVLLTVNRQFNDWDEKLRIQPVARLPDIPVRQEYRQYNTTRKEISYILDHAK